MTATDAFSIPVNPTEHGGIILEQATAALYRNNAFRVLQLPVEATAREIARRGDLAKIRQRYGGSAATRAGLIGEEPEPDEDAVRTALQRLSDPERRLIDEFFWFWPLEPGCNERDEALAALTSGGASAAREAWLAPEQSSVESGVAIHNLAVLAHATALDYEGAIFSRDLAPAEVQHREAAWQEAFLRWRQLLDHEGFWGRLAARIHELDDPRLTTATARRLRDSLARVLLGPSVQLAVDAAEWGDRAEVRRHLRLIVEAGFGLEARDAALRLAVAPVRQRIKTFIDAALDELKTDPARGAAAAAQLLEQAESPLATIELLLGTDHAVSSGTGDEVAEIVLRAQVEFYERPRTGKSR